MSTFHAIVWIDHSEAHVLHFDSDHAQGQRVRSRSHHKHQGREADAAAYFAAVWQALDDSREVLLAGPGTARNEFRAWAERHHAAQAGRICDSVAADHPTDNQLVALARQFFARHDRMGADPSTLAS